MSERQDEIEWGIEFEGKFIALDHDVPMNRETAESALGEALDYGADPDTTFMAKRRVEPWERVIRPGTPAGGESDG